MHSSSTVYDMTLSLDPAGPAGAYSAQLSLPGRPPLRAAEPVLLPVEALANVEQLVLSPRPPGQQTGLRAQLEPSLTRFRSTWSYLGPALGELEAALVDGLNALAMSPAAVNRLQETLGTLLFEAIFRGPIRAAYQQAYMEARQGYSSLQIRLQLHDSLQNLPFELLHDPDHGLFLAANIFTTLVRGTPGAAVIGPEAEYPLRLLVVIASPSDAPPLAVDQELARLREGLEGMLRLGIWRMDIIRGPDTIHQLKQSPQLDRYDVLHFIGHGTVDQAGGHNGLVLEGPHGKRHVADPRDLNAVLAGFRRLRLLVLNACHGGRELASQPFSSIAHQLLRPEVPAVVAMQRQIADRSAIQFGDHLYRALARCRSIGEAVNSARTALKMLRLPETILDWFNPQVFLRSPDGRLFTSRDGVLPVDRRVRDLLEQGDLATALAVYEAAGDWDSQHLAARLVEMGQRAFDEQDWDALAKLSAMAEQHQVKVKERDLTRWREAARRRLAWRDEKVPALRKTIQAGDVVEASRAAAECDRLLDRLSRDREGVLHDLYGGDRQLRDLCRADDLDTLNDIRDLYRGPVIRASVLEAVAVLEDLLRSGGVPVAVPRPLGDEAWLSVFFVHPVADRDHLARTRAWLLQQSNELPADWVETARRQLGEDAALVHLALGQPDRAVAAWEEEARAGPGRNRMLAICHHLALMRCPRRERADQPPAKAWDEQELALWAVLFASAPDDALGFWQRWVWQREAEGVAMPSGAGDLLAGRLQGWLEAELTDAAEYRELEVVHEARPPLVEWLDRERERVRRLDALAAQTGQRGAVAAGPGTVRRLGVSEELLRLYRSLDSVTSGVPVERLVELRVSFSSLQSAWEAMANDEPPLTVLRHLRGLACAACTPRMPSDPVQALQQRHPREVRPAVCRADCPAFAMANPLHARLQGGYELFEGDLARLCRTLFLREALTALEQPEPDRVYFTQLLGAVHALADEDMLFQRDWQRLVARVQRHVEDAGPEPPRERIEAHLPLLRAVCAITSGGPLRGLLVDHLLLAADRLLAESEIDQVMTMLGEAITWDPRRHEAHELRCEGYLCKAEVLIRLDQHDRARWHLDDFDRAYALAEELLPNRAAYRERAASLRERLDKPAGAGDDLVSILSRLETNRSEREWENRLRLAEETLADLGLGRGSLDAALNYLNDAAYLAGRDAGARARIAALYLQLYDVLDRIADQRRVLVQARLHFPDNADIRRNLNALNNLPE